LAREKREDQIGLLDDAGSEALARLSEQVEKAVSLIRELRIERNELEEKVTTLQANIDELEERAGRTEVLERQQSALEQEREQIRTRIESILEKFEQLESVEGE
jgi:FtsZ-binding cell division protein ZapB